MSIQLSYSAASKYKMSPRAYYLHYILRLRSETLSSPLFFGNAIDLGLNTLLIQKMKNEEINPTLAQEEFLRAWRTSEVDGKTVKLSEPNCIKFSKSDYDESVFTDEDFEMVTSSQSFDPSWVSLRRKGLMMIDAYAEQVLPRIKEVLFVQKSIKMTNSDGHTFVGFIDFCARFEDNKVYIFDNKTSSIKYADDSVQTSEQLATYYEAMTEELKIDGAGYVIIPKKIRKAKLPRVPIEIKTGEISEKLIEKTFQMYDNVLQGIKMGNFECNPEGCCSQPWPCSYKTYCRSNGKDLTGLVYYQKK